MGTSETVLGSVLSLLKNGLELYMEWVQYAQMVFDMGSPAGLFRYHGLQSRGKRDM